MPVSRQIGPWLRQSVVRPCNNHVGPTATVAATEAEEPADSAARSDDDNAAVAIGDEPRLIKLGFAQVPAAFRLMPRQV